MLLLIVQQSSLKDSEIEKLQSVLNEYGFKKSILEVESLMDGNVVKMMSLPDGVYYKNTSTYSTTFIDELQNKLYDKNILVPFTLFSVSKVGGFMFVKVR